MLTIVFMQIEDIYGTFGCCPVSIPCIIQKCTPCVPPPCPQPSPPTICPPVLPCPPAPVCPLPPPPVICPPLPPPCPPPRICPPPPPPVICPPQPPPCPPPPICPPPIVCPPPIICPPPPPLPPPPQPPPSCPPQSICPVPAPKVPTYVAPLINDCCCTCFTSCMYSQTRLRGAKIFSAPLSFKPEYDPKCNDPILKSIMEENMFGDPTTAKRDIQRAAEQHLFKKFNVICSEDDFSYIAYTDTFCQHSNNYITCYAFNPLPEI
ncbi:CRE-GRL-4 protein [Dirofilaria immitis]|nr:CRE-GRL-4 protein [Dirofilaria immitis]